MVKLHHVLLMAAVCFSVASATEFEQITQDGTFKRDPRFANDGESIIYCYDETPDLIRMMQFKPGESEPAADYIEHLILWRFHDLGTTTYNHINPGDLGCRDFRPF